MRFLKWGTQYDVFSPQLDAEHRELFRLGAVLNKAVTSKASQERVSEVLRGLVDHVEDHFSHEERLMREMRYEAYDWHKRQHDGARRRIKTFSARIEGGETKAVAEMLRYLVEWMRDHTGVTDRMMSASLRAYERQHS